MFGKRDLIVIKYTICRKNFIFSVQQLETADFQLGQPPPGHDQADEGAPVPDPGSGAQQVEEGATAGRKRGSIRKQFGHHSKMVNT